MTIRKKGQITLPKDIRNELGLSENDILSVTMLHDKAIVLIPQTLKTPDLLKQSVNLAKKKGITLEEMILELDDIRHNA